MESSTRKALALLQAELLSLKERFQGALHLHKAAVVPEATSGPFPIRASLKVKAPAGAAAYDMQEFQVTVTLSAASINDTLTMGARAEGVAVQIQSSEMPHVLKERVGDCLKASWKHAFLQGQQESLRLDAIFDKAEQDFVSLLNLLPELVEAYESVDAQGASARRYAIVDPESHLQTDASTQAQSRGGKASNSGLQSGTSSHGAPALRERAAYRVAKAASENHEGEKPSASFSGPLLQEAVARGQHGPDTSRSAASRRESAHRQPPVSTSDKATGGLRAEQGLTRVAQMPANGAGQSQQAGAGIGSLALFPEQVRPEIIFLQRRYRHSVTLLPEEGASFVLQLEPTDPSWQRGKRLHLTGKVMATYPAAGSLELSCTRTPDLPPEICAMLDRILAAQIAALGGWHQGGVLKRDLLRTVVREIDNSGGQFLHLAEDVLLQNARRQQPGTLSSSAPTSSSEPGVGGSGGQANGEDRPANKEAGVVESSRSAERSILRERSEGQPGVQAEIATLELSDSSQHDTGSTDVTDREYDTDEDSETCSTSSQEEDSRHVRGGALGVPEMGKSSLEMHLEGLKLDNVDALEALRLNVQVACSRCGTLHEVGLATEAAAAGQLEQAGTCSKCSQAWSVGMRPLLAHAHSSCLARLRAEGCAPRDLLPSLYAAQCGGCSSIASFRSVQVGPPSERRCSNCHLAMGISFLVARFQQHTSVPAAKRTTGPRTGSTQRGGGPSGAAAGGAPLQPGPLPNLGACKHYAHSYRLLRFPCCGRRFSCDLCHEEATDGHEMKWAHRMVCGYCSIEQPLGERCKHCNKRLAHNASGAVGNTTRHWEGGEGCRNKKMLDRRDAAKYRGSKSKTLSKKAFRVGQEGARRRKKAAAA